ncbi:hypothetical protein M758_1G331200 [Ceratodon purpureus]|uniref:Uncharacterized protein n=1 Tax=Ceratodon purpureus TaxID=3225 RepID=A0A8T0JCC7_CERPU|nr:hypothetical protein KC19_1G338700 [Ceratodon purpureus]KAG0632479.1 hypothetical protein M758_1G331200 [Ceratodon purpureus]
MAHSSGDWTGGLRCSYRRATFILCTSNILVALFMLHAALTPVYYDSSSSPAPSGIGASSNGLEGVVVQTKEELERIEDSNRLRRELLPVHLIERVKEIQEETELEINRTAVLNLARQKVALELANRLRELKLSNDQATQKGEGKSTDARVQVLGKGKPKDVKHSNGDSIEQKDMAN